MTLKLTLKAPLSDDQKEKLLRKVGVIQDPPRLSQRQLAAQEKEAQKALFLAEKARKAEESLKKQEENRRLKEERRIAYVAQIVELKATKKKRRWAALDWLNAHFPDQFNLKNPKPLKIKIGLEVLSWFKEVREKDPTISFSFCDIRHALSYYAYSIPYFQSMIALKKRFDLEGNPVADLSEEEIDYARNQVAYITIHGKAMGSVQKEAA